MPSQHRLRPLRLSKCERRLIEQAFSINRSGKALTTILDDAHLMDLANLRKLRLLFEDFPKNHNLILIGRPTLLAALDLGVNLDIKNRVTYSVITKRLGPDLMRDFILRELDRVGLGQNTFTVPAVDLVVRCADGVLRKARNQQFPVTGKIPRMAGFGSGGFVNY